MDYTSTNLAFSLGFGLGLVAFLSGSAVRTLYQAFAAAADVAEP